MAAKFELKHTEGGEFTFNLKASNGQVVLTSQTYADRKSALKGIESVRKHAAKEGNFERKVASNGKHYFVLNASNGQVIGKSQMYASAATMAGGIASVAGNAAGADVNDLTVG